MSPGRSGSCPAAAFQLVNPKAWIFALGAVTTFRPAELPAAAGGVVVALTMMLVIVPTAALWAGAGGRPRAARARSARAAGGQPVLAGMLVGTVALVWI